MQSRSGFGTQEAVQFGPPADLDVALATRRGQGSHGQLAVEVLGDLRLRLDRLVLHELFEVLDDRRT
jgi:hypothetical protein